jgi:hypothetical protein
LEGTGQLGHDDQLPSPSFEGRNHLAIEETRIGADPDWTHRSRPWGEAGRPPVYASSVPVAGAQFPGPEISRRGLETDPGMISRTSVWARVVTDAGLLLMPVPGQHRGVPVEQDTPQRLGTSPQWPAPTIVEAAKLEESARRTSTPEATPSGGVGIRRPSREKREDTVGAQPVGRLYASQPQENRIEQGPQPLGDAVSIVAWREWHVVVKAASPSK